MSLCSTFWPRDTSWYGDQPSSCYICGYYTVTISGRVSHYRNGVAYYESSNVVKCTGCGLQYKKV